MLWHIGSNWYADKHICFAFQKKKHICFEALIAWTYEQKLNFKKEKMGIIKILPDYYAEDIRECHKEN